MSASVIIIPLDFDTHLVVWAKEGFVVLCVDIGEEDETTTVELSPDQVDELVVALAKARVELSKAPR